MKIVNESDYKWRVFHKTPIDIFMLFLLMEDEIILRGNGTEEFIGSDPSPFWYGQEPWEWVITKIDREDFYEKKI